MCMFTLARNYVFIRRLSSAATLLPILWGKTITRAAGSTAQSNKSKWKKKRIQSAARGSKMWATAPCWCFHLERRCQSTWRRSPSALMTPPSWASHQELLRLWFWGLSVILGATEHLWLPVSALLVCNCTAASSQNPPRVFTLPLASDLHPAAPSQKCRLRRRHHVCDVNFSSFWISVNQLLFFFSAQFKSDLFTPDSVLFYTKFRLWKERDASENATSGGTAAAVYTAVYYDITKVGWQSETTGYNVSADKNFNLHFC